MSSGYAVIKLLRNSSPEVFVFREITQAAEHYRLARKSIGGLVYRVLLVSIDRDSTTTPSGNRIHTEGAAPRWCGVQEDRSENASFQEDLKEPEINGRGRGKGRSPGRPP